MRIEPERDIDMSKMRCVVMFTSLFILIVFAAEFRSAASMPSNSVAGMPASTFHAGRREFRFSRIDDPHAEAPCSALRWVNERRDMVGVFANRIADCNNFISHGFRAQPKDE